MNPSDACENRPAERDLDLFWGADLTSEEQLRRWWLGVRHTSWWATVGTALAATMAGALAPALLGSGTRLWVVGGGLLALGLGLYLGFSWLGRWQAKRRGIFLALFALGPGHQREVAEKRTGLFENWVRQAHPGSPLLESYRKPVTDSADLEVFFEGFETRVHSARAVTGYDEADVVLSFGGREDVAFRLGQRLVSGSTLVRPVWVVSDTDWTYEESHLPVGCIPGRRMGVPFRTPSGHVPTLRRGGRLALSTERVAGGEPQVTTVCRSGDQWQCCKSGHRHAGLVVGVDTSASGDPCTSRIATGVLASPLLGPDVLLVLVTASALAETEEAYRELLELTRDAYADAEDRLRQGARRSVALAAPSAFSVLLGARYLPPKQGSPWRTLSWYRDHYVLSFEPETPPAPVQVACEPGVRAPAASAASAQTKVACDPGVRVRNFTPHDPLVLHTPDGSYTFPKEGEARCQEEVSELPELGLLPQRQVGYGSVAGLPDPEPGTVFLVSQLVVAQLPQRTDLVFPYDTIRDSRGTATGFRALGRLETS
ncbi:MAG: hypothetical protein Q4G45_09110 [Actinomycetia bacterium]|nr:hypothetical protein [Actinomycetes bacterium]